MTRDPAEAWGRLIAVFLMVGIAVTYFAWGSIVRLSADETKDDVALWVYDTDAAPGDSIDAHVRIDKGLRVRIQLVTVEGAGDTQRFEGAGQEWGNTITEGRVPDEGAASVDFAIAIPETDANLVHLSIRVDAVAAEGYGTNFVNDEATTVFARDVVLHTRRARTVRRVVRTLGALGSAVFAIWIIRWLRRRIRSHGRVPRSTWLLLVPFAVTGCCVFWPQLSAGLRVHGVWFGIACMVAWWLILAISVRRSSRRRLRKYQVTSAWIATEQTDVYRSASAPCRVVPAVEIEDALRRAGILVQRRRRSLDIFEGWELVARVPVSRMEAFGDEPFDVRAAHREIVERMLRALQPVLGELRAHAPGEPIVRGDSSQAQSHLR